MELGEGAPNEPRTVARWREAGRWWDGEPYLEVRRILLPNGAVREETREMPCIGDALAGVVPARFTENHTEDHDTRFVKVRDEKVLAALGMTPEQPVPKVRRPAATYALLHACSGYAFGRGLMLAEEVPAVCASRGVGAALLADPFSLAGAAEFVKLASTIGVRPLVGSSFLLEGGGEIVLVARNAAGWRSLSRLVTECHEGEPRLFPLATWERLERHAEGLLLLTGGDLGPLSRGMARGRYEGARALLDRMGGMYGRENVAVQIERSYAPWQTAINGHLLALADEAGVLPVAGGLVTHARRHHYPAQDVLAAAHSLGGIEEVVGRKGPRHESRARVIDPPHRSLNAERFVRSPGEMAVLFRDRPDLVQNTMRVAEMCEADVLPGRVALPNMGDEPLRLDRLVWQGARRRYGWRSFERVLARRISRELKVIDRQGFAPHFLVAAEMCAWADERGIAQSGRGSVVDSVVAYCLGMSRIDAHRHGLEFDRFLPEDGTKRPDIDIDFEANRREEVRQWFVSRFGSEHVATVCAYSAYSTRGIIRAVGKVMGLPEESIGYLAKKLHGGVSPKALEDALDKRPELRDANIPRERFRWVFRLAERLTDVPRGIQAHPSGIVVSAVPIRDVLPVVPSAVEGVSLIQWDKRSAKRCFDKFDCLCLRALDILSHAEERIRPKEPGFDERAIPSDDPETFAAMRRGDLVGITQSASPAMTSAHVRVRTDSLPDAALVQACIRPGVGGAIKNDLLVARRFGQPYELDHPDMEGIVGKTYGIVVYQEQVDQLLVRFAGYTPGEAEEIREGIYKKRRENYVAAMKAEIVSRVTRRYDSKLAETIYDLVAPYQGYGFAEGHALAFAETTIRSLHTKIHHPAEFFAAALEAQPAGYYPAHTLANEARNKGVRILPLCVNASGLVYSVEDVEDLGLRVPNGGVRLPLTRVEGVSRGLAARIVAAREGLPYLSLGDLARRCRPDGDELAILVQAGAFDALHSNRRAALWGVSAATEYARTFAPDASALPVAVPPPGVPEDVSDFLVSERALLERKLLGLDVARHLMGFERDRVADKGALTVKEAKESGARVMVVGNPMRLRMPPTKSGRRVVFFDLEDETGLLNLTVFDDVYLRDGHALVTEPYVVVWATPQDRQGHKAFLVSRMIPYRPTFAGEPQATRPLPLVTADFLHS